MGEVGGLEKFRVSGVNPGRVGDDDGARAGLRPWDVGLEDLCNIGSAGTGGTASSSSSSLPLRDFFERLLKNANARALVLPGDFVNDLIDDAER